ncbi:MAG: gliding motility-associated protein GldE [Bacteroidales bacterium]|nr:gliding motility-associated protein GldE [Bacteroidales bacterium]
MDPLINVAFYPAEPGSILAVFIVLILLVGSALISGSEVAYFSLSPTDKQNLEDRDTRNSRAVLELIRKPVRLLGTILITNNFINVGIVIISSFVMNRLINFGTSKTLQFMTQVVIVTFILLLFGEILPKLYANLYASRFAQFMAYPLKFFEKLFYPISSMLIYSTSMVNRRLARKKQNISMDDLSEALELTSKDISEEKNILEGIIKFGNIDVKEIMKARIDVVSADIKTNLDELISIAIDSGYSRIPIYDKTFDNVKGILYIKDLLPHIHKSKNFKWQSLIRPLYYVPENKKIDDLLNEFQTKKIHMAIVVDEYGGTSGIITLEDIIEEIVGEITDESDEDEVFFDQISGNEYLFDGKILLNDLYKILETEDDIFESVKGDADTLAGLILELKGDFPDRGEKTSFRNFEFIIEAVDKRRIKQIRLIISPENEETA